MPPATPLIERPAFVGLHVVPLKACDHHTVIASRLVTQPSDDGCCCPLFDRDSFGAGHGAGADRRGVNGDSLGQPVSKIGVVRVESQEHHDRSSDVFDILGLCLFPPPNVGHFFLCKPFGGSLSFEFATDSFDVRRRGPNAPGENLSALLLCDDPMIASDLRTPGQGGVTRSKQNPIFRYGQNLSIGSTDFVRVGPGV